jgi:CubicO group peptidase (beta-lactamase class C family)
MTHPVRARLVAFLSLALAGLPLICAANDENFRAIEAYVGHYQEMAAFDGVVLIARGDKILWQKAFGLSDYCHGLPMTTGAVFRIASLSKQVTQAAIGRLIDQQKLSLDSTLAEFLPQFPNGSRITVKQLLEHSAGIAHTNRLDWMDMRSAMTLDEIIAGLADEGLLFQPGTDQRYSNGGYAILAKIIEVASGTSYDEFIAAEFTENGFPSLGHESAFEVVPGMAGRYAPGPKYGQRIDAELYVTANRIGGGSIYANAGDVFRFFRASYGGDLLSADTSQELFRPPDDGDTMITGRSPGALAQIYMDFAEDLTVVTLSSNSAWPGSFNPDIVSLYRGEDASLTGFTLDTTPMSDIDASAVVGDFIAQRFGWEISIVQDGGQLVFVQDQVRTAFARTTDGEFHLPIYDWLCRYGDYGMDFECRQRDPDAEIRFRFTRR